MDPRPIAFSGRFLAGFIGHLIIDLDGRDTRNTQATLLETVGLTLRALGAWQPGPGVCCQSPT